MESVMENIISEKLIFSDGIYSYPFVSELQQQEVNLRKSIIRYQSSNEAYLTQVAKHHSIPVMRKELIRFLAEIPHNGNIIDAGGGWGWHWLNIEKIRPDVKIYLVDFVKENLLIARDILKTALNKQVFLVHGKITDLLFADNSFDGYWSVQTLQHIPNFEQAISESHRVLKSSGIFANYSLNNQLLIRMIYKIFNKHYPIDETIPGKFYLCRASQKQKNIISQIYGGTVAVRYSEILFSSELGISFMGREKSLVGRLDSWLSSGNKVFSIIARQMSFHTQKK
jgi:ubiquinone/menaquinone biosynthesis C-methylase UbiE